MCADIREEKATYQLISSTTKLSSLSPDTMCLLLILLIASNYYDISGIALSVLYRGSNSWRQEQRWFREVF